MNTDIDGTQINECTKWHGDGFKCVVADDCVDGYFDNSGGVPAIRGDDDDYVDVDEVSYHYGSPKYLTIFYRGTSISTIHPIFIHKALGGRVRTGWNGML